MSARTVWLVLAVGIGAAVAAPVRGLPPESFPEAGAASLIQRLEPGWADGEATWLAERGLLRVAAPASRTLELRFRLQAAGGSTGHPALAWQGDGQWYGSAFWTGPDWTRVGRDWQHPGEHTPSVRCWRAPTAGRVMVSGRVRKLHLDGDGVRVSVRLNDREVWRAELEGKDGQGVDPALSLDVLRGDALRFVVHKRGQIFCDTTGWDPTITYADGPSFVASRAFGPAAGREGWFYEQLGGGAATTVDPLLHGLDQRLNLRVEPLGNGQAAAWPAGESLPGCVLADGDRSGVLLAVEPAAGWSLRAATADGLLRLTLEGVTSVLLGAYDGAWAAGVPRWAALLQPAAAPAFARLVAPLRHAPEFDLFLLAQAEWRREDKLREPSADYLRNRLARRDALLDRAVAALGPMLFCKRAQPSYSHEVAQYFGWRQRPGGGLFVLEQPGRSLRTRDLLGGNLPAGSCLEPTVSFDGRRVAFSYVATPAQPLVSTALPVNEAGGEEAYFHLYEVGADGHGLRQLTRGRYDDLMPCYLPDGALACVSTRRRSYSRCFGPNFSRRWHSYTLHRLEPGGEPTILSVNDVNEWFPALGPDGRLLFARWDYIDRDAVTHQNLWAARPDGTNPVAVWGNATPKPHCTFQAKAIPGSQKLVLIASAHHAITGGPVCLLDPTVDANSQAALRRLTPGPLPEAEGGAVNEYYAAPWPLSEDLFLVSYSPERLVFEGQGPNPDHALGLYLLDSSGHRELLYRDGRLGSTNPQPLATRPTPPVLPSATADGPPAGRVVGEMLLTDVYQGLGNVPRGSLKELRIVELFPKTTWLSNVPRIGIAGEENARAILGTVPIEADGSARFLLPARTPVLFQALDREGFAYQTMRSSTYVQPGEQTACVGCHERPLTASRAAAGTTLAARRPPSTIVPGDLGGRPFSYAQVVQPVLDRQCANCHTGAQAKGGVVLTGEAKDGFTRSYWTLCGDARSGLVPRFAQRNQLQLTPPGGRTGALGSRLLKLLRDGHYQVRLSDAEQRALAAWLDLNAVFRGGYDEAAVN